MNNPNRSHKDYFSYDKEMKGQEEQLEKMKTVEEPDEHKIKKQLEMVEETMKMIPDCKQRIQAAYEELVGLVADYEEDEEMKENADYKVAQDVIKDVTEFLQSHE